MSTNSKKSIKEIVLLSLGAVMIGSSIILGFLILGNAYSQVITNVAYYYNAMIRQQITIP